MTLVKIPHRFFIDHVERDLPAPVIVKRTKSHLWIDHNDANFAELRNDAEHYATAICTADFPHLLGIVTSAKATIKAIRKASNETTQPAQSVWDIDSQWTE